MELNIIYDGINLDEFIQGYETVNVEGRGLFAPKLNVLDIEGKDGAIVTSQQLPSRLLKVHFLIRANNATEKKKIESKLNNILISNEDVEIRFTDEDAIYLGRFSNYTDTPYDYFQGTGMFELYCQEPAKLSEVKTTSSSIESPDYPKIPVKWEEIRLNLTAGTSKITIRNSRNGQRVILNGSYTSGQVIIISHEKITKNGQNILADLDHVESEFHNFELIHGDSLTVTGATYSIKYRERWY